MAPDADGDDGEFKSARSKRKAKAKANARKRAAAGDVVNPYAALENDEEDEISGDGENAKSAEGVDGGVDVSADEARPKTSHSDASDDTLVGANDTRPSTAIPTIDVTPAELAEEPPKDRSGEWTYEEIPDISEPTYPDDNPDEPLTEAELRHEEIKTWLIGQKGHAYSFKKATIERVVDFIDSMKYEEDRVEWMKEVRLVIWRAVIRSNFWWKNPDTGEPTGKPEPINAPTGVFENNFNLFVACAAERLDRIGRDLPDPEYVRQVEECIRLFFRRAANKNLTRPLEHLAFILLIDEEQNRILTKEDVQSRLRMCFDAAKSMDWRGMGSVTMGVWPTRKAEPPLRSETVWVDLLQRFQL